MIFFCSKLEGNCDLLHSADIWLWPFNLNSDLDLWPRPQCKVEGNKQWCYTIFSIWPTTLILNRCLAKVKVDSEKKLKVQDQTVWREGRRQTYGWTDGTKSIIPCLLSLAVDKYFQPWFLKQNSRFSKRGEVYYLSAMILQTIY